MPHYQIEDDPQRPAREFATLELAAEAARAEGLAGPIEIVESETPIPPPRVSAEEYSGTGFEIPEQTDTVTKNGAAQTDGDFVLVAFPRETVSGDLFAFFDAAGNLLGEAVIP